jgi:translation elongation factor EF-1alpha
MSMTFVSCIYVLVAVGYCTTCQSSGSSENCGSGGVELLQKQRKVNAIDIDVLEDKKSTKLLTHLMQASAPKEKSLMKLMFLDSTLHSTWSTSGVFAYNSVGPPPKLKAKSKADMGGPSPKLKAKSKADTGYDMVVESWLKTTGHPVRVSSTNHELFVFEAKTLPAQFRHYSTHKFDIAALSMYGNVPDVAILVAASDSVVGTDEVKPMDARSQVFLAHASQMTRMIVLLDLSQEKVGYAELEDVFSATKMDLIAVMKKAGFISDEIPFIPIMSDTGDNLFEKRTDTFPWYKGKSLVECLDAMTPDSLFQKSFRLPVGDVLQPSLTGVNGLAISGIVATGQLEKDMSVKFCPSNVVADVTSIQWHGYDVPDAVPGDSIHFLVGGDSSMAIKVGDVASDAKNDPCHEVETFWAMIFILDESEVHEGQLWNLRVGTSNIACTVSSLSPPISLATGKDDIGQTVLGRPYLKQGQATQAMFKPSRPLSCETFSSSPDLGRFLLMDDKRIIGLGYIKSVHPS